MSIVKSFAIGSGDMYYIRHGSDNFSIIDCSIPSEREGSILAEFVAQCKDKRIRRFISTHPDQDHISGLVQMDEHLDLVNFCCVKNAATKSSPTADFERYCELRDDPKKAFHLFRGCTRRWMNEDDDERGSAGLSVLWPILENADYKSALRDAENGMTPNNISCVVKYSVNGGPTMLWMGDLETDFMGKIEDEFEMPAVDILFAPHHGRTSGKVPKKWLSEMDPALVMVGEAPAEYLDYYAGYNTLTQNSTGDLLFESDQGSAHIFAGSSTYVADHLTDMGLDHKHGMYYIGSVVTK